jgi:LppX_LprAFG lipoprotein
MRRNYFLPIASLVLGSTALSVAAPSLAQAQKIDTKKLALAAKATNQATTLTFEMVANMTMDVGGKKSTGVMTAKGQRDTKAQASSVEMDIGSYMKAIMGAAGGSTKLPPAFNDPANFKIKVIQQGPKMWMSFPLLSMMGGTAAPAKPWVGLDAKELGIDARQLAASQGADPMAGLDVLQGFSQNATVVGTEDVKGTKTTHYKGTSDFAALTKNLPAKQAADAKKLFGTKTSMPVDVWLDDQGRARRMDLSFTANQSGVSMSMNTQYYFMKFGEPVSITPPPADQVGTAADNPLLMNSIKQATAAKAA